MLVSFHLATPGQTKTILTDDKNPDHACVSSLLIPRNEKWCSYTFLHAHIKQGFAKGGCCSLSLSAQCLPLPHPEGHGDRGMETEEKIVIRGRAQSSAERQKHLRVSQTFYTRCTQSQQLCNAGSTDEKLICMQQLEVYRAVLVCHCDLCSPGRFQQCLKIILEAYPPAWPRIGRRKRSICRATAVI